jgi:hypothetical protein
MRGSLANMDEIEASFQKHAGLGKDACVVFFEGRNKDDQLLLSCCVCSRAGDDFQPVLMRRDTESGDFHIVVRSLKRPALDDDDDDEHKERNWNIRIKLAEPEEEEEEED